MPVVVSFVSQKGGVGKSTLARALAILAAESRVSVLVADLDAQQNTVMRWHEVRISRGIKPKIVVQAFNNIDEALQDADDYQLVIIDASGGASSATLDITRHSHLVVQPTGPGLDDLHPGVLLFHELVGQGIPSSRLIFALCRTATKEEEFAARTYLHKAKYAVLPGSIPERATYRAAQNSGHAIIETGDDALNKRAEELLTALLGRLSVEIAHMKSQATTKPARGRRGT